MSACCLFTQLRTPCSTHVVMICVLTLQASSSTDSCSILRGTLTSLRFNNWLKETHTGVHSLWMRLYNYPPLTWELRENLNEKTTANMPVNALSDYLKSGFETIERWHQQHLLSYCKMIMRRSASSLTSSSVSQPPYGKSFTWCIHKVQVRCWSSVSWWPAEPRCNHTGSTAHCEVCTQSTFQRILTAKIEISQRQTRKCTHWVILAMMRRSVRM